MINFRHFLGIFPFYVDICWFFSIFLLFFNILDSILVLKRCTSSHSKLSHLLQYRHGYLVMVTCTNIQYFSSLHRRDLICIVIVIKVQIASHQYLYRPSLVPGRKRGHHQNGPGTITRYLEIFVQVLFSNFAAIEPPG